MPRTATLPARLVFAGLLLAGFLAAHPARAWDTTPWNAAPFDQPSGMTASQRAKVGAAEARTVAVPSAVRPNNPGQVAPGVGSGSDCQLNVGTATVPAGPGAQSVVTNVNVKGDIINICR